MSEAQGRNDKEPEKKSFSARWGKKRKVNFLNTEGSIPTTTTTTTASAPTTVPSNLLTQECSTQTITTTTTTTTKPTPSIPSPLQPTQNATQQQTHEQSAQQRTPKLPFDLFLDRLASSFDNELAERPCSLPECLWQTAMTLTLGKSESMFTDALLGLEGVSPGYTSNNLNAYAKRALIVAKDLQGYAHDCTKKTEKIEESTAAKEKCYWSGVPIHDIAVIWAFTGAPPPERGPSLSGGEGEEDCVLEPLYDMVNRHWMNPAMSAQTLRPVLVYSLLLMVALVRLPTQLRKVLTVYKGIVVPETAGPDSLIGHCKNPVAFLNTSIVMRGFVSFVPDPQWAMRRFRANSESTHPARKQYNLLLEVQNAVGYDISLASQHAAWMTEILVAPLCKLEFAHPDPEIRRRCIGGMEYIRVVATMDEQPTNIYECLETCQSHT